MVFDTNTSTVSSTTTSGSGAVTRTTSDNVLPRLTVNADTLVYPSLRLSAGGVFEISKSWATFNGQDASSSLTRLRPYFELRSINPTLSPGFAYYRRENRSSFSSGPSATLVSEDYAGFLGWKPEGLPQSTFQYVRTHTFDGERRFRDTTRDLGSILSEYRFNGGRASYQGSYLATDNRVGRLDSTQIVNAGRVDYSRGFLDRRLRWNATYNISRQNVTTIATELGGEVVLPATPVAGLAVISDTPQTAALSPNPTLIDGNFVASTGIDLGVPGIGPEAQARNIGVDFVIPTEVNRLWIWVDRDLPAEVARSFSWEIYTSADNITWTRHVNVAVAPFGPFDNRFEVDFSSVTARYLKIVTRPLSAALPESSAFADVFVTELQAFVRRAAQEARNRLDRTSHLLNSDVRLLILEGPSLYYEGSFWFSDSTDGPRRDTLSNGVSVNRNLGRLFTAYGRAALEQGTQPEGDRTARVGNASLTFNPLATLRTSLLYTGQAEHIQARDSSSGTATLGDNDRHSVIVQTSSQVYRGVDVLFGFGWNFATRGTGEEVRDRLINVSAIVAPRPNVVFSANYTDTGTTSTGLLPVATESRTRRGYFTMAIDPIRTLHLVVGEDVASTTGEQTRLTHNFSVNWAPLPDGALQFITAYNEALRDLVFGTEKSFVQSVRWTFSRQSYLLVSYQRIESQNSFDLIQSRVLSANLRLFF